MESSISVPDEQLLTFLYLLEQTEGVHIEPSAAAGFSGPMMLFSTAEGEEYRAQAHLNDHLDEAQHLIWTTGGMLLPESEYSDYWRRGEELIG